MKKVVTKREGLDKNVEKSLTKATVVLLQVVENVITIQACS